MKRMVWKGKMWAIPWLNHPVRDGQGAYALFCNLGLGQDVKCKFLICAELQHRLEKVEVTIRPLRKPAPRSRSAAR